MNSLPNKKYDLIYCDPPWSWKTWSDKGQGRSASQHYNIMTLQNIKDLPVQNISKDNSILCMWIINAMIPQALEVIQAWGFEFKTVAFTWTKKNKKKDSYFWGMGYYTRQNTEMVLLARRGKGLKRKSRGVHQILDNKIREHSRKPDECRKRLELLFGDVSKIELFARETTTGWDVWGNETDKFITSKKKNSTLEELLQ